MPQIKIEKVLNNNMVLSRNTRGQEVILKGRAIGFGRKKGDEIDSSQVERVFVQENKNSARHFEEYLAKLPQVYWEISEQTVDYAKEALKIKVDSRIVIPICDHIAGAVERCRQGTVMKNVMLWEGKKFYPNEFKAGLYAVDLVRRRLHIDMGEDEAMFIAFHFISGQIKGDADGSVETVTRIIQDIVTMVESSYQITLDEESWDYQRFITHIRFFAQRMLKNQQYGETEEEWYHIIKNKYPRAYNCIVRIAEYIHDQYEYEMDREEMVYLMIHIEKVTRPRR